jgi:hypothetical protein
MYIIVNVTAALGIRNVLATPGACVNLAISTTHPSPLPHSNCSPSPSVFTLQYNHNLIHSRRLTDSVWKLWPYSPHPRFPHCRGFRVAIHISGTGQDHFPPASSVFPSGNCILKLSRSTHCGQPSLGRENQLSQWSSAYCHFTLLRHPRPPARASVHRTQPPATLHLFGPSMRTKDPSGFARRGAQRS